MWSSDGIDGFQEESWSSRLNLNLGSNHIPTSQRLYKVRCRRFKAILPKGKSSAVNNACPKAVPKILWERVICKNPLREQQSRSRRLKCLTVSMYRHTQAISSRSAFGHSRSQQSNGYCLVSLMLEVSLWLEDCGHFFPPRRTFIRERDLDTRRSYRNSSLVRYAGITFHDLVGI